MTDHENVCPACGGQGAAVGCVECTFDTDNPASFDSFLSYPSVSPGAISTPNKPDVLAQVRADLAAYPDVRKSEKAMRVAALVERCAAAEARIEHLENITGGPSQSHLAPTIPTTFSPCVDHQSSNKKLCPTCEVASVKNMIADVHRAVEDAIFVDAEPPTPQNPSFWAYEILCRKCGHSPEKHEPRRSGYRHVGCTTCTCVYGPHDRTWPLTVRRRET